MKVFQCKSIKLACFTPKLILAIRIITFTVVKILPHKYLNSIYQKHCKLQMILLIKYYQYFSVLNQFLTTLYHNQKLQILPRQQFRPVYLLIKRVKESPYNQIQRLKLIFQIILACNKLLQVAILANIKFHLQEKLSKVTNSKLLKSMNLSFTAQNNLTTESKSQQYKMRQIE